MVFTIYVGSYTNDISTLSFNPEARSLAVESSITVGFHPSWITPHPKDRSLIFTGLEQSDGQIVAVKFDQRGHGTIAGTAPSGGRDPCILLAAGSELLIGNVSLDLFFSRLLKITYLMPICSILLGSSPQYP